MKKIGLIGLTVLLFTSCQAYQDSLKNDDEKPSSEITDKKENDENAKFYGAIKKDDTKIDWGELVNKGYIEVDEGSFIVKNTELFKDIKSIVLNKGVVYLKPGAFKNCSALESIETQDTLLSIGELAFDGCSSLKSFNVTSRVANIKPNVFSGCTSLETVTVDTNNKVYDSRNNCNAIIETYSNTLITACLKSTIPEGVTKIGNAAFSDLGSITSITIPNTVVEIGDSAFTNCKGLTSLALPSNITSIGGSAFFGCENIASAISFTNKIKSIGLGAFKNCKKITSISIPYTDSGEKDNNNKIIYVTASIGDEALFGCEGLNSIELPKDFQGSSDDLYSKVKSFVDEAKNSKISWVEKPSA